MSLETIQLSINVKKAQQASTEDAREKARLQDEIDDLQSRLDSLAE